MNLREIRTKKTAKVEEMRSILDKPANNGNLSEEQEKRFATLKAEVEAMDRTLEKEEFLNDQERRAAGHPVKTLADFDAECRSFSILKAVQASMGMNVDAGREKEISQELAHREGRSTDGILAPYSIFHTSVETRAAGTISTAAPTSGPGSNLIGTDFMGNQYVDLLREANPLSHLGLRHLSGLVGNVSIPKATSGTSVAWFTEGADTTLTDMSFGEIALSPKTVGARAQYSRNMMLQSSPDIERLLRSDMAQALGLEIGNAVINGNGSGAPVGILHTNGINSVSKAADAVLMDDVPVLNNALFQKNVTNISYLGSKAKKLAVEKQLTTDGLPVGEAAYFRNASHVWTGLLPEGTDLLAGDFSQVILGTWSSVEIMVNPYAETLFRQGAVALRIILTMDVAIRHPEAFAVYAA